MRTQFLCSGFHIVHSDHSQGSDCVHCALLTIPILLHYSTPIHSA